MTTLPLAQEAEDAARATTRARTSPVRSAARLLLKACAVALRLAGIIALGLGIAALRARWNQRSHRSAA